MDRVFSVDDMADHFWLPLGRLHDDSDANQQPAPPSSSTALQMTRSASEWAFQRFLQEATTPDRVSQSNRDAKENQKDDRPLEKAGTLNIPTDSKEYQAFLKSRLDLACAAVALNWARNSKPREDAPAAHQEKTSSQFKEKKWDSLKPQDSEAGYHLGTLVPTMTRKLGTLQVRSTTSGSSGDQSDDEEAEGESENTQSMDPTDEKRMRRMLSNRESARRSRRRKQAHLTDLETQVSQLRVENSSLLKRLSDINQKYNEAFVDNRVLKADVETLRAKVKMAEESVKRVTGLNPIFQAMSDITTMGLPSLMGSPVAEASKHHSYRAGHVTDRRTQIGLADVPSAESPRKKQL